MSTVVSSSPAALGVSAGRPAAPARRVDGARGLATLLLAAGVAALVVLADQLIDTWADGHLFLGWIALWVVIFAGSVLMASTARRAARSTMAALDDWSRTLAEARAEARLWELAKLDPRLKAELIQARTRADQAEAVAPVEAPHDYTRALAPLGIDSDGHSPALLRRLAQTEMQRQARYLPYI